MIWLEFRCLHFVHLFFLVLLLCSPTACVIPKSDALRGCEGVWPRYQLYEPFPMRIRYHGEVPLIPRFSNNGAISVPFLKLSIPWYFSLFHYSSLYFYLLYMLGFIYFGYLYFEYLFTVNCWEKRVLPSNQCYISFITNQWLLVVSL